MPSQHRYSRLQLEEYFNRVQLPESARNYDVSALGPDAQLNYLKLLTKHQLVAIPFENLTLHYSWHRVISTDAQHVFDKIVKQPGRGGYCMENNTLLHVVLVSLGFDVYMLGARVHGSPDAGYGGVTHCLNVITIGDVRYTVDVGFGGNGPIRAYTLEAGLVQEHIAPAQVRYRRGQLPGTTKEAGMVWFYEHRQQPDADWAPMYSFAEAEILPADVQTMNLAPSLSRTSIFQKQIMCVQFTTEGQTNSAGRLAERTGRSEGPTQPKGEIDGVLITIGSNLKWRQNGEKKLELDFSSERERLDALETYYGIYLDVKDQAAIEGTPTAIAKRP
jgi:arylamine N-acetyltransferase